MPKRIRVTKSCGFPTTDSKVSLMFPKGDFLVTDEMAERVKEVGAGKDSPKIFTELPDYTKFSFKPKKI